MLDREYAACLRLLRNTLGDGVRVTGTQSLGSAWAPVERLTLSHDMPGIGRTVIVKTRRHGEGGWGGDPLNLATEHHALSRLQQAGIDAAPEVVAWDEADGILVMRDLAPAQTVESFLFQPAAAEATAALVAEAACTGRIQAATTAIGAGVWNSTSLFGQGVRPLWEQLADAAVRLNFPDPAPVEPDVDVLERSLADPRWRTLTHGDLTPGNALFDGNTAHLVDFEGAGPRHALLDGAGLAMAFPAYGRWAAIPPAVVAAMTNAYREELARGMPLAENDAAYDAALATGCAAWAILRLARLGLIASEDQDPAVAVRRRTQIVHTVESCVTTARQANAYPALTAWLESVTGEMRRRWPEANAEPRQYPAFAAGDPPANA